MHSKRRKALFCFLWAGFLVRIQVVMASLGLRVMRLAACALAGVLVSACQGAGDATLPGPPAAGGAVSTPAAGHHLSFSAPDAWGGEARCMADGCKVILVEHETNHLVLLRFEAWRWCFPYRLLRACCPARFRSG